VSLIFSMLPVPCPIQVAASALLSLSLRFPFPQNFAYRFNAACVGFAISAERRAEPSTFVKLVTRINDDSVCRTRLRVHRYKVQRLLKCLRTFFSGKGSVEKQIWSVPRDWVVNARARVSATRDDRNNCRFLRHLGPQSASMHRMRTSPPPAFN